MLIELEPIFNNIGEQKSFDYTIDFSNQEFNCVFPFKTPVMVKGVVKNAAGIVVLESDVTVTYDGPCDRCGEEIEKNFDFSFSHTLVQSLNDEENDDLMLVEDMHFDVDEIIFEDVFLSLPTKILCSDECAGVCPQCGKNLNSGKCDCQKTIDPRLEVLRQLLDEE